MYYSRHSRGGTFFTVVICVMKHLIKMFKGQNHWEPICEDKAIKRHIARNVLFIFTTLQCMCGLSSTVSNINAFQLGFCLFLFYWILGVKAFFFIML
jgi:hypothetical protein